MRIQECLYTVQFRSEEVFVSEDLIQVRMTVHFSSDDVLHDSDSEREHLETSAQSWDLNLKVIKWGWEFTAEHHEVVVDCSELFFQSVCTAANNFVQQ